MKKTSLIIASIALAQLASAQTLQDAIKKTTNERFESAAADFRSLIAKEPTKGENYFYYGENFLKNGDSDSALVFFQKGTELNPTYALNYVGIGKVNLYAGKDADAKTAFFKAATLSNNKNAEVMRKTAEAYINAPQKNPDEAIKLLTNATKIDSKNPDNFILMGDAVLEKNPTDGGPAIKNYNQATALDPKSAKGILRTGKLYERGQNYQLALDLYKQAIAADPNYAPAYREIAELYHKAKQDGKAIENYKKYLELNDSPIARERYATFLFSNKNYADAVTEITALQTAGNNNFYLDRYLGYSYAELGDKTDKDAYTKGLASINKFFDKSASRANFKYLPSDYKYKGLLLAKSGQDSLGILEIEKAINLDPTITADMLREIASIQMKAKKYAAVCGTYEKLLAGDPKNLKAQDWYEFGRANYYEGGNKQREKKDADAIISFIKADTCFSKLCQLNPSYPMGYYWRGRVNAQIDPKDEKALAKPHYEKALEITKPDQKATYKTNIIEANSYLGSHFAFSKEKDLAKAKEYFKAIQELDPNNKAAIDFFKSPAGK